MDENGYIDSQWPSKRIPPGGLFHSHKIQYTPETQKMLKVLMDEAKLTLMLKKKMDWCLRTNSSLSDIHDEDRRTIDVNTITIRPRTSRRRSYSIIKKSGDLERERFRPTERTEDREKIKKHLQDIMEFGKDTTSERQNIKNEIVPNSDKIQLPSNVDMLHELLAQIQEREQWLVEMELLGEGAKHREVIQAQIAERIRGIQALNILPDKQNLLSQCSSNNSRKIGDWVKECNKKKNDPKNLNITCEKRGECTKQYSPTTSKESIVSSNKSMIEPSKQWNDRKTNSFTSANVKSRNIKTNKKTSISRSDASNEENIRNFSLQGSCCLSTERTTKQ